MRDVAALPTLPELCEHVLTTLCQHDNLDPNQTPIHQALITRHGKPAGVLVGFASEDDWFNDKLENDPRFLKRIAQARRSLKAGMGDRLEDIET